MMVERMLRIVAWMTDVHICEGGMMEDGRGHHHAALEELNAD